MQFVTGRYLRAQFVQLDRLAQQGLSALSAGIQLIAVTKQAGAAARMNKDDIISAREKSAANQVDHAGEPFAAVNRVK